MDGFAPSWRSDPPFITGVACRPQRKVRADRNAMYVLSLTTIFIK